MAKGLPLPWFCMPQLPPPPKSWWEGKRFGLPSLYEDLTRQVMVGSSPTAHLASTGIESDTMEKRKKITRKH